MSGMYGGMYSGGMLYGGGMLMAFLSALGAGMDEWAQRVKTIIPRAIPEELVPNDLACHIADFLPPPDSKDSHKDGALWRFVEVMSLKECKAYRVQQVAAPTPEKKQEEVRAEVCKASFGGVGASLGGLLGGSGGGKGKIDRVRLSNFVLDAAPTGAACHVDALLQGREEEAAAGALRHPCLVTFGSCDSGDACTWAQFPGDVCPHYLRNAGKCELTNGFRGSSCQKLHINLEDPRFVNLSVRHPCVNSKSDSLPSCAATAGGEERCPWLYFPRSCCLQALQGVECTQRNKCSRIHHINGDDARYKNELHLLEIPLADQTSVVMPPETVNANKNEGGQGNETGLGSGADAPTTDPGLATPSASRAQHGTTAHHFGNGGDESSSKDGNSFVKKPNPGEAHPSQLQEVKKRTEVDVARKLKNQWVPEEAGGGVVSRKPKPRAKNGDETPTRTGGVTPSVSTQPRRKKTLKEEGAAPAADTPTTTRLPALSPSKAQVRVSPIMEKNKFSKK